VARRANRLPRWLRAHGGYAMSLFPALFQIAATQMRITYGDTSAEAEPTVLAAFANTPAYGGGMKIAPDARLDDGVLDLCIIRAINKVKLTCLFPTIYFGKHLQMREVEYQQTRWIKIETKHPSDVYADGEYVCRTPVEVGVLPKSLKVIA